MAAETAKKKIGVIYCETLEAEIKAIAALFEEIVCLKAMQWGLHIEPDRLLMEVRREILEMQEQVDAIVLGYGRCQAMDRLGEDFKTFEEMAIPALTRATMPGPELAGNLKAGAAGGGKQAEEQSGMFEAE